MQKISFKGHTFYIEEDRKLVYSDKKELIGSSFLKKVQFENIEQFWDYLKLIYDRSKQKEDGFLNLNSFCVILAQNLSKEGVKFSPDYFKNLIRGINYVIVKQKDVTKVLGLIDQVRLANNLEFEFKQFTFSDPNCKKKLPSNLSKYLCAPYGELSKNMLKTVPVLYELILEKILSS